MTREHWQDAERDERASGVRRRPWDAGARYGDHHPSVAPWQAYSGPGTSSPREFGDEHLEHSCQGGVCQHPHVGEVPWSPPAGHPRAGPGPVYVGRHRGRGPKGYTRSDARILENVCDALMDDADVDASDIEVRVEDGTVTLSGTVSERSQKRLAEDVAAASLGVRDVQNDIRVGRSDETP